MGKPDDLLTTRDIAALLRQQGVRKAKPSHVWTYLYRARLHEAAGDRNEADMPEPDKLYGNTLVWYRSTIDRWLAVRRRTRHPNPKEPRP